MSFTGGAINYGLQQIQGILKELGSKKGVAKTQGSGIRKLLWPYVQKKNQPMVNVLFTLSPSDTNIHTTRDTFRVATTMANLKIKPVKVKKPKSKDEINRELKKIIREQEMKIKRLEKQIQELQQQSNIKTNDNDEISEIIATQRNSITLQTQRPSLIEFDANDLMEHKEELQEMKQEIIQIMDEKIAELQSAVKNGDKLEDDQEVMALKKELEDVDKEIERADAGIDHLEEMDTAIRRYDTVAVGNDGVVVDDVENKNLFKKNEVEMGNEDETKMDGLDENDEDLKSEAVVDGISEDMDAKEMKRRNSAAKVIQKAWRKRGDKGDGKSRSVVKKESDMVKNDGVNDGDGKDVLTEDDMLQLHKMMMDRVDMLCLAVLNV